MGIDQRTAFGAGGQRNVEMHQIVDGPAAAALPGAAGDRQETEARRWRAVMAADRQHDVPGAQRSEIGGLRHRHAVRLEAQCGDIGGWIAPDEGCRRAPSAGQRQRNLVVAFQHFLGGDDDTGAPVNAARRPSAAMHGDHAAGRTLDDFRGVLGELRQRIVGLDHDWLLRNNIAGI